jgi:UDP-glucuronate 4-epimerase
MLTKILVTGAAGFIGFNLSKKLLAEGYRVVGIDNLSEYYDVQLKKDRLAQLEGQDGFIFHKVDISDKQAMEKVWDQHPDCFHIINLAAQAGVRYSLIDPFAYIQANVIGHLVMLELARYREGFQHFVYASSSSVYGSNKKVPFAPEDRTDSPIAIYAATKKSDELMTQTYNHLFGIPATGLRFFTVYGPWGRPDMAAYLFADAIMEGKPIKVFNHGKMRRDFTYVDDIVDGIIGALNRKNLVNVPHKIYNLGGNHTETLENYIATIETTLGKEAQKEMLPLQEGDVPETYADISASTEDFGFVPKTRISEGIPKFIAWYKDYHARRLKCVG